MGKDLNILFIIIDALMAKNLSSYGYTSLLLPNDDVYSCSTATDPSLTSIFSGKYHMIMELDMLMIR